MIQIKNIVILSMLTAVGISGCGQEEQEDGAMQSMFSEEHYEVETALLEENQGLSEEEAKQIAFQYQLEEIATAYKAKNSGIEVTEEEAVEFSKEFRESLESGEMENAEAVLENKQEKMEKLDITEEEYWQEFRTHESKMELYAHKLVEHKSEQKASGTWVGDREEVVQDFKDEEAENIEEFKENLGISS